MSSENLHKYIAELDEHSVDVLLGQEYYMKALNKLARGEFRSYTFSSDKLNNALKSRDKLVGSHQA